MVIHYGAQGVSVIAVGHQKVSLRPAKSIFISKTSMIEADVRCDRKLSTRLGDIIHCFFAAYAEPVVL
jgi:hypothetical protein